MPRKLIKLIWVWRLLTKIYFLGFFLMTFSIESLNWRLKVFGLCGFHTLKPETLIVPNSRKNLSFSFDSWYSPALSLKIHTEEQMRILVFLGLLRTFLCLLCERSCFHWFTCKATVGTTQLNSDKLVLHSFFIVKHAIESNFIWKFFHLPCILATRKKPQKIQYLLLITNLHFTLSFVDQIKK